MKKDFSSQTAEKKRKKKPLGRALVFTALVFFAVFLAAGTAGCAGENETLQENSDATFVAPTARIDGNEAVRMFFKLNSDKFPESENVKTKYFGGVYLDEDNNIAIMLTDLSGEASFEPIADYVYYVKCDYSYDELTHTMSEISERMEALRRQGDPYAEDYSGMILGDIRNRIWVSIYHLDDEKAAWFRENVCDKECVILSNTNMTMEEKHVNM